VGPEAARGGIMGVFSPGQLPQELEKVIFALKEGEVSPVVASSYGYHIFRVDKKTDFRLLTAAEAAPLVRSRLREERGKAAVAAYLAELKASLTWTLRPENLAFAYQRIEP
jgi:parvulin-like peptidyl-prolyl isomerase